MPPAQPWTSQLVAEKLVAAFRRVPTCPVLSSARGFSMGGVEVEPFGWPERFVADRRDRNILMTWARCRATGEPVKERYRALQWQRDWAERRRRLALLEIARGLSADMRSQSLLTLLPTAPDRPAQAELSGLE